MSAKEKRARLEELFHVVDILLIYQKQNNVIVSFYLGIAMSNNNLFIANDSANGSTRWQFNITNLSAHHFRGVFIAVRDGLNGFSSAPAQRVNIHNVTTTYVSKQGRYSGLLGLKRNVDFATLN